MKKYFDYFPHTLNIFRKTIFKCSKKNYWRKKKKRNHNETVFVHRTKKKSEWFFVFLVLTFSHWVQKKKKENKYFSSQIFLFLVDFRKRFFFWDDFSKKKKPKMPKVLYNNKNKTFFQIRTEKLNMAITLQIIFLIIGLLLCSVFYLFRHIGVAIQSCLPAGA